jgi:hypothetical protein
MVKVRRGGYIFFTWKGDHTPKHVHVYRNGKLVVKWDLENGKVMQGVASQKVLELIRQLQVEGMI